MAYEIPFDLIHRLQSALREEAGIPLYDPSDPALPPLPSIEGAVEALDPSLPPNLRCKRCRGGLLRGLQSTLCIYCGADWRREGLSYEISFNSTVGCRKLLESLGLDGSEAVTLDTESGDSKGKHTPKGGMVLSDLLDLELKWPLDTEEVDDSNINKEFSASKYAFNLSGFDLDNCFFEHKIEAASASHGLPNEQMMPEKQSIKTECYEFSGSDSLFENLRSSDVKASSFNDKSCEFGDPFTVWEAEFHTASSNTSAVDSKSVNLFQDCSNTESITTLRPQATICQQTDRQHDASSKNDTGKFTNHAVEPSSTNNWIPDDFWSVKTGKGSKSDQLKSSDETNIGELNSNLNHMPDHRVQEDSWPASSTKEYENTKSINDNDDSFDDWQNFMGAVKQQGSSSNLGMQTEPRLFELPSEIKSVDLWPPSGTKESDDTKNLDGKNNQFDDWQGFTSSSEAWLSLSTSGSQAGATLIKHPSERKSVDLWSTGIKNESDNTKNLCGNDDSFDDWQGFTSSSEAAGSLSNLGVQIGATLLEHPSEINSVDLWSKSSTKDSDKASAMDLSDYPFDDWQGLSSFGETKGSLLNSRSQIGDALHAHLSDTKSVDQQVTEFGSFLHSDSFSGASGSQEGSSGGNSVQLDASISNRMGAVHETFGVDSHSTVQEATDITKNSTSALNPESANSKVEMLLSQMHDLSFMLENDLSIPEKIERSDANS